MVHNNNYNENKFFKVQETQNTKCGVRVAKNYRQSGNPVPLLLKNNLL